MRGSLNFASLKESSRKLIDGERSIKALVADHESVVKSLRDSITEVEENCDAGTADFLTALMRAHEKMAWMLRSFVR